MKAQDWEEISTEYQGKIINGSYKIDRNIVTVKTGRGTKKAAPLRGLNPAYLATMLLRELERWGRA